MDFRVDVFIIKIEKLSLHILQLVSNKWSKTVVLNKLSMITPNPLNSYFQFSSPKNSASDYKHNI